MSSTSTLLVLEYLDLSAKHLRRAQEAQHTAYEALERAFKDRDYWIRKARQYGIDWDTIADAYGLEAADVQHLHKEATRHGCDPALR